MVQLTLAAEPVPIGFRPKVPSTCHFEERHTGRTFEDPWDTLGAAVAYQGTGSHDPTEADGRKRRGDSDWHDNCSCCRIDSDDLDGLFVVASPCVDGSTDFEGCSALI